MPTTVTVATNSLRDVEKVAKALGATVTGREHTPGAVGYTDVTITPATPTASATSTPRPGDRVAFPDAYPGRTFVVIDWEAGLFATGPLSIHQRQINHDATPWHIVTPA